MCATERELLAMCSSDDRWSAFLRGYMQHSSRRLAWNCHVVKQTLGEDDVWLDIGSFGVEALWLLRARPATRVHCVSYEGMELHLGDEGIAMGRGPEGNSSITIAKADVEHDSLPMEDNSCDVITCFECIEHLRTTPRHMLDEIRRVLKPNGKLLMTTPNVVGSRAMVRLLAGKHPQENPRYHRNTHYGIVHPKEYTMRELVQLLHARGLQPVARTSHYYRPVKFGDRLAGLVAMITRPLGGRILGIGGQPVLMGDNLFVVATPHTEPLEEWPSLSFEPDNQP